MTENPFREFLVYENGEIFYRAEVEVEHQECGYICPKCHGSGEGSADGQDCIECHGDGVVHLGPKGKHKFTVTWDNDKVWGVRVEGDPIVCEECGHNFMDDILEELEWLKRHGKNSLGTKTSIFADSIY